MPGHFGNNPHMRVMPVGRCVVGADGNQIDGYGENGFTTVRNSVGSYTITPPRVPSKATAMVQVLAGNAAQYALCFAAAADSGEVVVTLHDAAGALADGAFTYVLWAT